MTYNFEGYVCEREGFGNFGMDALELLNVKGHFEDGMKHTILKQTNKQAMRTQQNIELL